MPVTVSYPGVYIEELPSGVHSIAGVATSITAFVGYTARGPVDQAVRIANFSDYERNFGGLQLDSEIGYAVQQFFQNGGSDAYVVRVAKGAAKRVFAEGVDMNPQKPEDIPDHGCLENLTEALKPWDIPPEDIPSPFNIFQTMRIDPETGAMFDTMIRPKDEAHVDFRAEMDCLVAVSACPQSGRGEAIRVEIFEA